MFFDDRSLCADAARTYSDISLYLVKTDEFFRYESRPTGVPCSVSYASALFTQWATIYTAAIELTFVATRREWLLSVMRLMPCFIHSYCLENRQTAKLLQDKYYLGCWCWHRPNNNVAKCNPFLFWLQSAVAFQFSSKTKLHTVFVLNNANSCHASVKLAALSTAEVRSIQNELKQRYTFEFCLSLIMTSYT